MTEELPDMADLAALAEDLGEVVADNEDLLKLIPYIRYAAGAYRWVRTRRAKAFLRALANRAETMTEEEKSRLHKLIESPEGAELVSDYIDSVLRTSSPTVAAAFALLLADPNDERYSKDFKFVACVGLEGLREEAIRLFLSLEGYTVRVEPRRDGPYPVYLVNIGDDSAVADLSASSLDAGATVALLNDLIRRGLLWDDHTRTRGDPGRWSGAFGVSERTQQFWDLLKESSAAIEAES